MVTTATTAELNIMDGDTSASSTTVADADRVVFNDAGTMKQVAVTDLAAYFDDEITAMPNLVTTGALNSGSITSGFGAIDNGSSNITTTGVGTFGSLDISGDIDVDGTTNLDVVDIDGAVDMASTLQVDGAITSSAGATITTADNTSTLTLQSTDADANAGPFLKLRRDSGSPADADLLGSINFTADDDGGNETTFATISTQIGDASNGTESGALQIKAINAGSFISRADFLVSETVFNQDSVDIDFRVESDGNANMLVVDAGNDRVGIGTSTVDRQLHIEGNSSTAYSSSDFDQSYNLIKIENTNTSSSMAAGIQFLVGSNGETAIGATRTGDGTADLCFGTRGSGNRAERMRLTSAGRLGIGTTSPSFILDTGTNSAKFGGIAIGSGTQPKTLSIQKDGSGSQLGIDIHNLGTATGDDCVISFETQGSREWTTGLDRSAATFNISKGSTLTSNPYLVIDDSGNVGIGTSIPDSSLTIATSSSGEFNALSIKQANNTSGNESRIRFIRTTDAGSDREVAAIVADRVGGNDTALVFETNTDGSDGATERVRINQDGAVLVGLNAPLFSQTIGLHTSSASAGSTAHFNRSGDGGVVRFGSDATEEGNISISGTTVSYNGGHLARWSQATDGNRINGLVKGTVMTNLNQMAVWHHEAKAATLYEDGDEIPEGKKVGDEKTPAVDAYDEDNEQLNCMAVSSVEGDVNVAGVFVNWDDDEVFTADMNVAMTGDMVIRIAQGTTVTRGDLLMSAGDGTAKPQGDDIVRSKTIAKVTSTNVSHTYDDKSYCVPCVLMAC